jgi:NADPH-dependent glutamate synthase beta subunit-like oxidoreductase/Pyruvate/2-oxoacid:ferredoxin oxidoreductase delta subunit
MAETNPIHQSAMEWPYEPFSLETGLDRIVAYGDRSGLCPTYQVRTPPCTNSCPAGEDIRGYNNVLRGIWKGEGANPWEGAFYRLAKANPFPAVMGRVCPAPCQGGCNRQYRDETVGINSVEHAIGQYAIENNLAFRKPETSTGKKVAVVGSGPGGLSCAYQMALRGHAVTLFERDPKLGGMMRYGIMGYRVDRNVMEKEIQRILDLGVEVRTNTKIGVDISLEQLRSGYDAVFLAVGAQKGRSLPVPGSDGPMCTNAIDFLREFELKGGQDNPTAMNIGKRVVVIGDGDVAMDVARLALRLGSQSTLLSAVARADMNCSANEFEEAVQEGTVMEYQAGTKEVLRDGGRITGVKCIRMVKKAQGEEGWNHPIPFFRYREEPGTEFVVECDMVVASIGQTTEMAGLEATTGNTPFFQVDHNFQIKGMPGVFGGGDAVKITLLTTAIGHGRKAAEAMDLYLKGQELPKKADKVDVVKYDKLKWDYFVESRAKKRRLLHPAVVNNNWDEILQVLQQSEAVDEAKRCMSCGLCFECKQCELYCPQKAIVSFKGNPEGQVMFTMYERCVGCHICSEVCPTGFIDMGMG